MLSLAGWVVVHRWFFTVSSGRITPEQLESYRWARGAAIFRRSSAVEGPSHDPFWPASCSVGLIGVSDRGVWLRNGERWLRVTSRG